MTTWTRPSTRCRRPWSGYSRSRSGFPSAGSTDAPTLTTNRGAQLASNSAADIQREGAFNAPLPAPVKVLDVNACVNMGLAPKLRHLDLSGRISSTLCNSQHTGSVLIYWQMFHFFVFFFFKLSLHVDLKERKAQEWACLESRRGFCRV